MQRTQRCPSGAVYPTWAAKKTAQHPSVPGPSQTVCFTCPARTFAAVAAETRL